MPTMKPIELKNPDDVTGGVELSLNDNRLCIFTTASPESQYADKVVIGNILDDALPHLVALRDWCNEAIEGLGNE